MPGGSYKQSSVLCPFYKYDDGRRRITCEGFVEASNLALIYRHTRDFNQQIDTYCCEHYKSCEVYRMLMAEKYGE